MQTYASKGRRDDLYQPGADGVAFVAIIARASLERIVVKSAFSSFAFVLSFLYILSDSLRFGNCNVILSTKRISPGCNSHERCPGGPRFARQGSTLGAWFYFISVYNLGYCKLSGARDRICRNTPGRYNIRIEFSFFDLLSCLLAWLVLETSVSYWNRFIYRRR